MAAFAPALPLARAPRHARCAARPLARCASVGSSASQPPASLAPPTTLPTHAPPRVVIDGRYARAWIWVLRAALRSRTDIRSAVPGYGGLVEECHMLQVHAGAREQQAIVESLLRAAVFAPVGVVMFRTFFAHRPAFNADLTPRAFTWLVGEAERNKTEEGGEGVLIKQCRFLDEARCKGLYVFIFSFSIYPPF